MKSRMTSEKSDSNSKQNKKQYKNIMTKTRKQKKKKKIWIQENMIQQRKYNKMKEKTKQKQQK